MVWTECMDEWMPTISALLQPTSEVKAIVSRLFGLGILPSYLDFSKLPKKEEKTRTTTPCMTLYWTTSRDLTTVPPHLILWGGWMFTSDRLMLYISWDTVAYQKYLLNSHWSRLKQKQLDTACTTSKENNTHSTRVLLLLPLFLYNGHCFKHRLFIGNVFRPEFTSSLKKLIVRTCMWVVQLCILFACAYIGLCWLYCIVLVLSSFKTWDLKLKTKKSTVLDFLHQMLKGSLWYYHAA